jgi:hypothetical protein
MPVKALILVRPFGFVRCPSLVRRELVWSIVPYPIQHDLLYSPYATRPTPSLKHALLAIYSLRSNSLFPRDSEIRPARSRLEFVLRVLIRNHIAWLANAVRCPLSKSRRLLLRSWYNDWFIIASHHGLVDDRHTSCELSACPDRLGRWRPPWVRPRPPRVKLRPPVLSVD